MIEDGDWEDDDNDKAVEALKEIINPTPEPTTELVVHVPEIEDDAEFARQAIRRAVKYAEGAVKAAGDGVAASENNPRATEVLVQAIKTMAENAKTLMDTKKVDVEINKTKELKDNTQVINNNLFVTPAELLRLREEAEEKKKKDGSSPS